MQLSFSFLVMISAQLRIRNMLEKNYRIKSRKKNLFSINSSAFDI